MKIGDKLVQGREGNLDLAVEYTIASVILGCSGALTTSKEHYQQTSLENTVSLSEPSKYYKTEDYKIVKVDLVTFLKAATAGNNKNPEQSIHLISSLKEEYDSKPYSSVIDTSYSAADIISPFVVAAAGVLILKGIRKLFMPESWDNAISKAVSYPVKYIGCLYTKRN